jgi:hypothetical protein
MSQIPVAVDERLDSGLPKLGLSDRFHVKWLTATPFAAQVEPGKKGAPFSRNTVGGLFPEKILGFDPVGGKGFDE